jgi:hypothetical protein
MAGAIAPYTIGAVATLPGIGIGLALGVTSAFFLAAALLVLTLPDGADKPWNEVFCRVRRREAAGSPLPAGGSSLLRQPAQHFRERPTRHARAEPPSCDVRGSKMNSEEDSRVDHLLRRVRKPPVRSRVRANRDGSR